jgi:hypothetical protein
VNRECCPTVATRNNLKANVMSTADGTIHRFENNVSTTLGLSIALETFCADVLFNSLNLE